MTVMSGVWADVKTVMSGILGRCQDCDVRESGQKSRLCCQGVGADVKNVMSGSLGRCQDCDVRELGQM